MKCSQSEFFSPLDSDKFCSFIFFTPSKNFLSPLNNYITSWNCRVGPICSEVDTVKPAQLKVRVSQWFPLYKLYKIPNLRKKTCFCVVDVENIYADGKNKHHCILLNCVGFHVFISIFWKHLTQHVCSDDDHVFDRMFQKEYFMAFKENVWCLNWPSHFSTHI